MPGNLHPVHLNILRILFKVFIFSICIGDKKCSEKQTHGEECECKKSSLYNNYHGTQKAITNAYKVIMKHSPRDFVFRRFERVNQG